MIKYPEKYRVAGTPDDDGGAFKVPYGKLTLFVIASHGAGWDHVSVSLLTRTPTWDEMCFIKDLFFESEDCVIQYHPPKSQYKNVHPFCLHLWRPQNEAIPMPPEFMV